MSDKAALDALHNPRQRELYKIIDRLYGKRLGLVHTMRLAIELDHTPREPTAGDVRDAAARLGI